MRFVPRLSVRAKFHLVLVLLIPLVAGLSWISLKSLSAASTKTRVLHEDIHTLEAASELRRTLQKAQTLLLRQSLAGSRSARTRLRAQFTSEAIPSVTSRIEALANRREEDSEELRSAAGAILRAWETFLALYRSPELSVDAPTDSGPTRTILKASDRGFGRMISIANEVAREEIQEADAARTATEQTYERSRVLVIGGFVMALVSGSAAIAWLTHDIVPRIKNYSVFAARVGRGKSVDRLQPRGRDELSELGVTLNTMAQRRERERELAGAQLEYTDTLQSAESPEEAYSVLKQHLETQLPGSSVIILTRNNSADRLQAMTEMPENAFLRELVGTVRPKSCLAVRFGKMHSQGQEREPLLSCALCSGDGSFQSTCHPLLVTGEVIGSVQVSHRRSLLGEEVDIVRNAVGQASPVIGNLRNLAIAEARAATDSLTGLPNARAVQDNLKRMVAQAGRSLSPLAVVALDLDHFKQINDSFGHGRGDDVLAAVGAVLSSTVRDQDFVGRQGGEEFIMLLPNTGRDGAISVAEKVRSAISNITIVEVTRDITISAGVAVFPDDGGDAITVVRNADRALYQAKAAGRDRVDVFESRTDFQA
jgi:diguanylate cyclase (GGDEF)-like protein